MPRIRCTLYKAERAAVEVEFEPESSPVAVLHPRCGSYLWREDLDFRIELEHLAEHAAGIHGLPLEAWCDGEFVTYGLPVGVSLEALDRLDAGTDLDVAGDGAMSGPDVQGRTSGPDIDS